MRDGLEEGPINKGADTQTLRCVGAASKTMSDLATSTAAAAAAAATVADVSSTRDNSSIASLLSSMRLARGIYWPDFRSDWDAHLDELAKFEPRKDDVFVISYPKCGHHWSHEFLSMIINGTTKMPKSKLQTN